MRRREARRSLLAFVLYTFASYARAEHLEKIADKLEAIERGDVRRLMIFMPPRHGKSELATRRFPAWYLGRNPDRQVISASYGQELATDFGRDVRDVVSSAEFHALFPGVDLREDSAAAHHWQTSKGGIYIAAGVGSPITGRGADLAIIDDPIKNREEASSETYRERVWRWYTSTLYTRLMPSASLVVIQTRWHEDDLAGRLLAAQDTGGDKWEVLEMPALDSSGNALWPDRYSAADLAKIKSAIGSYEFGAQYQQRPSPEEGGQLKRGWWKFYDALPAKFDEVIQSWDCAFKETKTSDFVVGQAWGKIGGEYYLLPGWVRDRMDFPATCKAIEMLSAKVPEARAKLIEDKANGSAVIDTLKRRVSGLIPVEPEGGKEARVAAISPLAEAGNVYLPDPSLEPRVMDFVEECAAFPFGANDDQVDCASQALIRLSGPQTPGIIGFYSNLSKQRAAKKTEAA